MSTDRQPLGVILYEGPSMIDGQPIVCIATGLERPSRNDKTGPMVQTWIIRSDVSPIEAINSGDDSSVCGQCELRGTVVDGRNRGRKCYVSVKNAPRAVYNAYWFDRYECYDPGRHNKWFRGRNLRLGAYGDPAAVPYRIWSKLCLGPRRVVAGFTGYTHQWRESYATYFKRLCMASVESMSDRLVAKSLGWRTFRVRSEDQLTIAETICPASNEGGKRTTCDECLLCCGTSLGVRDVTIVGHGGKSVLYQLNDYLSSNA